VEWSGFPIFALQCKHNIGPKEHERSDPRDLRGEGMMVTSTSNRGGHQTATPISLGVSHLTVEHLDFSVISPFSRAAGPVLEKIRTPAARKRKRESRNPQSPRLRSTRALAGSPVETESIRLPHGRLRLHLLIPGVISTDALAAAMEPRIGNRFRVGRKLGSGSFGEIFLGLCTIMLKDLVLVPKSPSLTAADELFPCRRPGSLCVGVQVPTCRPTRRSQ
jgi:hypothetical protein